MKKTVSFGILAFCTAGAFLALSGCGGGGDGTSGPLAVGVSVARNLIGADSVTVSAFIMDDGFNFVDDAVVTVNGQDIPNFGMGIYHKAGAANVNPGETVTLTITRADRTVSGTVVMPVQPVVTAPTAAGGPYENSSPVTVTWNPLASTPDEVWVEVDSSDRPSGETEDYSEQVPSPTDTTFDIPADTYDAPLFTAEARVKSLNASTSLGPDAVFGSELEAVYYGFSEEFETQ
ncbi:MAG: hypothetical protein JW909_13570 [Planctomycetes bacterium]|nr:hypothetical protein [Planctomycetota bacterium]